MAKKKHIRSTFDQAYYHRFYENPKTAVISPQDVERLAMFVIHYLTYLHVPVKTVLDVGCGVGLWKQALKKYDKNIKYTGIEVSQYLCDTFGWIQGSIVDFSSKRKYDLVICQGVLPYLKERDVSAGIKNLNKLCRGALYLEAVTVEDSINGIYDEDKTDSKIYLRKAKWYRKRIHQYFIGCGGGLFFPKDTSVALFELEKT
jgi:2-polyprenyl-3-methyl-5-hydroxy-6-metoxy-1,4-benzoquinol methylase